jgi:hypothetical protein
MIAVDVRSSRVRWPFRIVLVIAFALLAHATWDYTETRRLRARLDAIVRSGEPMSPIPYVQLSGGASDADRFYRAASALVSGISEEPPDMAYRVLRAERDGEWPADVVASTRSLVEKHSEALDLVDRAAALPFDGFAPGTPERLNLTGPRWLWSLSRLCELRAAVRALDGQADAAAESLYSDVRLARTLSSLRPFTALPFVFKRSRPSAAATAKLSAALAELDRDDRIKQDFMQTRVRLVVGQERAIRNTSWIERPWFVHQFVGQLDDFSDLIAAAARPQPERVQAILAVGRWPNLFDLPPDRSRALLEGMMKSITRSTDALRCARRVVAGEMIDCPF